jgi:hypothetical protein
LGKRGLTPESFAADDKEEAASMPGFKPGMRALRLTPLRLSRGPGLLSQARGRLGAGPLLYAIFFARCRKEKTVIQ